MAIKAVVIYILSLLSCTHGAFNSLSGQTRYLPDLEYIYVFESNSTLTHSVDMRLNSEIQLYLLSETEDWQDLHVTISPPVVIWRTLSGEFSDQDTFSKVPEWFTIRQNSDGTVTSVSYPMETVDRHSLTVIKKSIAQILSIGKGNMDSVEKKPHADGMSITQVFTVDESGFRKRMQKKFVISQNGEIVDVDLTESILSMDGGASGLLNSEMSSHSRLVLQKTIKLTGVLKDLSNYNNIITEPPTIASPVTASTELHSVESNINDLLTCAPNDFACKQEVIATLKQLSVGDLSSLAHTVFKHAKWSPSDEARALSFIDALVKSSSSADISNVLVDSVLLEGIPHVLVRRVLFYLTTSLVPTESSVNKVMVLVKSDEIGEDLREKALLSLGSMSRYIRDSNPILSSDIILFLHNMVENYLSDSHKPQSCKLMTVINSIGNAADNTSIDIVKAHASAHQDLRAQLAAIRALSRYTSKDAAQTLQEIAETTLHPQVQHASASAYMKHPRATNDLSHLLKKSSLKARSRRSTDIDVPESLQYNVTMPSVNWGLTFGDENITVNMARNVLNSFDVVNDPFSTGYIFSIRDEATFSSHLLLSSGEQHNEFLQADLCLEGSVTYDTNMETSYHHLSIITQFNELQSVVDGLTLQFELAYETMKGSEVLYNTIKSDFNLALDTTARQLQVVSQHLEQFMTSNQEILIDNTALKQDAVNAASTINATYITASSALEDSRQNLVDTLGSILPLKLDAFLSSLLRKNQPFTLQSDLVPYFRYAPQTALAGIYDIYWKSGVALDDFEAAVNDFFELISKYGQNSDWTNPYLTVWSIEADINELLISIELEKENAIDDGHDTSGLQSLAEAISDSLKPALSTLISAADEVHDTINDLRTALETTQKGYDEFTKGYEASRSTIDRIFGQRFYPGFPAKLKSCDSAMSCGNYPATSGDKFRDGIDLIQTSNDPIPTPFAGYISRFDPSSLGNSSAYSYSVNNTVELMPTEFSLDSFHFIISNIDAYSMFNATPVFVSAGQLIGNPMELSDKYGIHVEAYKTIDNKTYAINPTQFVSPTLKPQATSVAWDCNEVTTTVNGVVVDTQTVVDSDPIQSYVGEPLVTIDIDDEEFPQPYELLLDSSIEMAPTEDIEFFQSSTFLMVGVIPVTFSFSTYGRYNVNMSLSASLLSRNTDISMTPEVWGRVEGSMRVGGALFATVAINGELLNASLPLTMNQNHGSWPLSASSTMDLVLYPTSLNLTTNLIQRVGVGDLATEKVLETDVPWAYDIPDVHLENEVYYIGTYQDVTSPVFHVLPYANESYCHIRQLTGRDYTNPAFEIEFDVEETEDLSDIQLMVGNYENGDNVLSKLVLRGERLVLPSSLSLDDNLVATVSAMNENELQSSVHCTLSNYDLSPPQARVVPFSDTTSHPNLFQVLLVLFDEYGLTEDMELAVGTVAGSEGNDLLDWITLKTDRVNQVFEDEKFSFPRNGRLIENTISVTTEVDDNTECSVLCEGHSNCLSYDHSDNQKRCILHSSIEGPSTAADDNFVNTFETLPLQVSQDFTHYEVLGKGHATMYTITDLELEHGQQFFINLKLQNELGYTNVVSSSSVLVDLTPPTPGRIRNANETMEKKECGESFNIVHECRGEATTINNHRVIYDGNGSDTVFNGPTPLYDALYTKANNFIAANWDGIDDRESGLLAYTWCISSTTEYTCDILEQENPHGSISEQAYWTNTGLARFSDLLHDGMYYITVNAINGVGYGGALVTTIHHTTPFILDTTPPTAEYLMIAEYDDVQNMLTVDFSVKDSGSGIKEVSISLGTTVSNTLILPWTLIDSGHHMNTSATVSVVVPDGVNGWVKLRAINNVGLETILTSNSPIIVDRTPPTTGNLNDGSTRGLDIDYQTSQTQICANWEGVSDPHSGISSFQWGVGTSPDSYDIVPLLNVTDQESAKRLICVDVDHLSHGTTYYSTLVAANGADDPLTTVLSSNGVKIDVTDPNAGDVTDGSGSDIQYSHSLTTVSATWSGFSDAESGIDRYIVSVYRRPQGSSEFAIVLTDNTITTTSYFGNHFNFANGDEIKVEVTGVNGAGLDSSSSSDGYTIDLTGPEVTALQDGLISTLDLEYLSDGTTFSVNWAAFDAESGIQSIEIALFHLSEGKKSRIFPTLETTQVLDDPSMTYYTIEDLQLVHDYKYIATLTFTNGAGLKSSFETNGASVDIKIPVVQSVSALGDAYLQDEESNGILMIGNNKQVEASWEGADDGSGIVEFSIAVVDDDDTAVPPGYIVYAGEDKNGRISNLNLTVGDEDNGPFYRIKVVTTDRAGHESLPLYSEKFWISGEDYAGTVYDGYYSYDDVDYTDELSSISTYFSGFFSTQCGGILQYQWAVGNSSDDKASILPFTTNGMVVVGNGSGYAQLLLPDLDDHQSEELYITVRGVTGCGGILESTSNGFVIDSNPPIINILDSSHKAVENVTGSSVYQVEQTFSSIWTVSENSGESISHVTVTIGSYPGADDLMNATEVDVDHIREDIRAPEGVPSYVTVTARNKAGLESVQYSNPVVMDTSPPEVNYVECSHSNDLQSQLKCYWNVVDSESDIDYFFLSLATDKLDKNRVNSTKVHHSSLCSVTFDVMTYSSGQPYYVTLYAYNNAELENIITSEPIYFDLSPPISGGLLFILPNFGEQSYSDENSNVNTTSEAFCVWHTNVLKLRFSQSSDEETGIKEYQLGIGRVSGSDDVLAFEKITIELLDNDWAIYTLHIIDDTESRESRQPYYFTVRAVNNAGLYSDITSAAVYVKSEANTVDSWVIDGNVGTEDRDYQHSTTRAYGKAFFGVNCPMKEVEWSIQGVDGIVVKDFVELDLEAAEYEHNSYSFSTDQVMYTNETYRLIVRGIDYSGQVHVVKSDGIVITTRPLIPGSVVEGLDGLLELNYQESLTSLTINYDGFGDGTDEQEIEYYEVALGSDREHLHTRSDIVPFTNVGLAKTHKFTGLDLIPLTQSYYATVRAHAVSGAVAETTSNGIVAGLTHSITPGTISQTPYQTNLTFLSAHWSGFESNVPITKYEWAVGTRSLNYSHLQSLCNDRTNLHESDFEVFGFQDLDTDTYAIASNLNLKHSLKYYVTLRVTDQSDMCIAVSSTTPTVIDRTVPIVRNITIGPEESRLNIPVESTYIAYLIDGNALTISWQDFVDIESNIKTYEVGFFELESCSQDLLKINKAVIEYADVGLINKFTFDNLHLEFNISYAAKIRATNHAGLKVEGTSNPVLLDTFTLEAGDVKDGSTWEKDLVFQSDLTKLSGVVALSYFRPQNVLETPCPSDLYYSLNDPHTDWSSAPFTEFNGLRSSAIRYESDRIDFSNETQMSINAFLDPTKKQLVSGVYYTQLNELVGQKSISVNVRPAIGDERLQKYIVTSMVILETSNDDLLVEYDPTVVPESASTYKALGLQIHTQESTTDKQQLILWSKDNSELSTIRTVSHDVALNISNFHKVLFDFSYEGNGLVTSRKVEVFVDGVMRLALHDIPQFTSSAKLVLNMFNREGYLPECTGLCVDNSPRTAALFSDVSLPSESNGACNYGSPFYSWGSPIVEVKAGIGTSPDVSNIKPLELVYSPCRPCIQTPCHRYSCEEPCPLSDDPETVMFSFAHLSLVPSHNESETQPTFSGSGSGEEDTLDQEFIGYFNPVLKPAIYYIIVETVSASGQTTRATSNGVLIDITPPVMSDSIRLYDIEFSLTQSSVYQGNNHTISATWGFKDLESGIVKYEWSIGTTPFGQEIQGFVSVGLETRASNSSLEGKLQHNETYYVTVRATNGAGLTGQATSNGITHLLIELNETELDNGIVIESSEIILDAANETLYVVSDGIIIVTITSKLEDVAEISWGLTSHIDIETAIVYDIFPLTDINNGRRISVDHSTLYIDNLPHSNISDIFALSDGVSPSEITGFYVEPGRIFYHFLQFCDLAHSCVQSTPRESIFLRPSDVSFGSIKGEDLNITIVQSIPPLNDSHALNVSTLDSNHSVTLIAPRGLQRGSWLFTGFLNEKDLTYVYHIDTPYISNPYLTMDRTSRELARRFTSIGGPSFFVSLFGQDTLDSELLITASFDQNVNWNESVPRLAYWDIDNSEWREVEDTCGSLTTVNWITYSLSVEVCSTIVDGANTDSRPSSLSRRRRNIETESASGIDEDFLERPVQFIVIERGNISLNTPPTLVFDSTVTLNEDETLTYTLQFEDHEDDEVLFYLTSVPKKGTAEVDPVSGILTYTPCENCFGYEALDIYIRETNLKFGEELDARGTLLLQIVNTNDPLSSFLFEGTSQNDTARWSSNSIDVFIEANRSEPVTVARVGVYDYDGYEDDIEVYVTSASEGNSGYNIWLDTVAVPESLPVEWRGHSLENFTQYITFVGVNVTYLPSDPSYVGMDSISFFAQQEDLTTADLLVINIEVLPSLCLNNGVCSGSINDPDCSNITNRRASPEEYNCSCASGYSGPYCQYSTVEVVEETEPECPGNIPKMDCGGNPCDGASCPGFSGSVCVPDYCGHCKAVWYMNDEVVQCSASDENICLQPAAALIIINPTLCDGVVCDCPTQPYECPEDSVFIETRIDQCCVTYTCQCPDISCPLLMDSGKEVMPHPEFRGGNYAGRCCPMYEFEDVDECLEPDLNMCSDYCTNAEPLYSCGCDEDVTLASNGHTCGVCTYNGLEYFYGDKVKIGCNWCTCEKDSLSGERWHCTAESCDPACYYNGATYPTNSQLALASITCVCEPTDTFAQWECQTSF